MFMPNNRQASSPRSCLEVSKIISNRVDFHRNLVCARGGVIASVAIHCNWSTKFRFHVEKRVAKCAAQSPFGVAYFDIKNGDSRRERDWERQTPQTCTIYSYQCKIARIAHKNKRFNEIIFFLLSVFISLIKKFGQLASDPHLRN